MLLAQPVRAKGMRARTGAIFMRAHVARAVLLGKRGIRVSVLSRFPDLFSLRLAGRREIWYAR